MIVAGVLVVDSVTKWWASTGLHRSINPGGFVSLEHSLNSGLSFSALRSHSWLVITLSIAVLIGLVRAIQRSGGTGSCVALALIFGGGFSNLIDRLLHGGEVTDFLGIGNWFFCNGADVAISVGVALLIVQVCMGRKVLR